MLMKKKSVSQGKRAAVSVPRLTHMHIHSRQRKATTHRRTTTLPNAAKEVGDELKDGEGEAKKKRAITLVTGGYQF